MIKFYKDIYKAMAKASHLSFIAHKGSFKKNLAKKFLDPSILTTVEAELKTMEGGLTGKQLQTYTTHKTIKTASFVCLPDKISRSNSPTNKHAIYSLSSELERKTSSVVVLILDDPSYYPAAAAALARRCRLYSRKTENRNDISLHIIALGKDGKVVDPTTDVKATAEAVQWCCRIVDSSPEEANPKTLAADIKKLFKDKASVKIKEISGPNLLKEKLAGVHAVGRCAAEQPRMLVLDYNPTGSKKTVALVGKGVTYDSGGLSLKISGGMVGMKADLGGAAAVIAAFHQIVATKVKSRVVAVVGVVENAIGPHAYRNDDIITMHSGKTVEINNTDAEGRVVLADCVSYVGRKFKPDLIVEAATLTGAQLIATGIFHAGIVTNDDKVESLALAAAEKSGDLVSPLPFAPEFFKQEFTSQVADMRNSVKNRMNAQSSCAAQFIYNHIEDLEIPWLHIDLAGPATTPSGLGTGFGVGLLAQIVAGHTK